LEASGEVLHGEVEHAFWAGMPFRLHRTDHATLPTPSPGPDVFLALPTGRWRGEITVGANRAIAEVRRYWTPDRGEEGRILVPAAGLEWTPLAGIEERHNGARWTVPTERWGHAFLEGKIRPHSAELVGQVVAEDGTRIGDLHLNRTLPASG